MIHQREISKKAYQEQKQDRVIEKDYVITWLLLGISRSPLDKLLAFKGGTALKKLYFEDYRYSEDLDFTVLEKTRREKLLVYLSGVFNDLEKEAALAFQINEGKTEERAGSTTLYVQFVGPLQGVMGSRDFKLDFTFNEKLVYPLSRRRILAPYSDCAGVDRALAAYSLEEIPEEYAVRSAINYVNTIQAPILMIHGAEDPLVPVSQAEEMYQALRNAGKTVEIKIYPNQRHTVTGAEGRAEVWRLTLSWFQEYL